jgi:hypothetical protein
MPYFIFGIVQVEFLSLCTAAAYPARRILRSNPESKQNLPRAKTRGMKTASWMSFRLAQDGIPC